MSRLCPGKSVSLFTLSANLAKVHRWFLPCLAKLGGCHPSALVKAGPYVWCGDMVSPGQVQSRKIRKPCMMMSYSLGGRWYPGGLSVSWYIKPADGLDVTSTTTAILCNTHHRRTCELRPTFMAKLRAVIVLLRDTAIEPSYMCLCVGR